MAVNLTAAGLAVELRVITTINDFPDLPEGQSRITSSPRCRGWGRPARCSAGPTASI